MNPAPPHGALEQVTSIKVKLGLLVAASVLVAAVLATLGAGTVPAGLSIPVTVLLALGVTQLLASGMTSPLRQMTEAVRRMAAGDYDVRVDTSATDEVGELARAFNRMAADLATVDRQRRELVATVSHELRTPLTALVAVLENLDDGVTEPDPATIRVALGQAERLSALVADLLDLSRVDAGVVALDRSEVGVAELLDRAVEELRAGVRGVSFDVRVEPPGLRLSVDRSRMLQLLANLLDNAVRHSPTGGVVHIWAGRVGTVVRIEVADQGSGIDPDDRERVFERFGTSQDAGGGGTGLGLAIARWVTDLHGGRIAVADPLPGERGARLRVDLPQDLSPAAPQPAARSTSQEARPMTATTAPTPPARPDAGPPSQPLTATPLTEALFGDLWPGRDLAPRRGVLLACLGIGVFAGLALPFAPVGLGAALVLLASGALLLVLTRHRRAAFTWACAGLAAAFATLAVVRDAEWIVVLGLLTGALLVTTALTGARTVLGMALGALAWPLAGLRGLPWLGRTLRAFSGGSNSAALVRTVVLSGLGVLVFGTLFASADAIFGRWVSLLLPDLGGSVVFRVFVTVAVSGIVLAAAYLALNPLPIAHVDEGKTRTRPTQHRFEWLAPVLLVDAVFVLFLAAQAAAIFGGDDYIREVTGLTYADYVHQGFAQLTVATVLTLLVVWAAARKVGDGPRDRAWLRGSLGALCLLTLVVVASALHRMDLYQDAYGFTRLRLLVDAFEAWLGLLILAVIVAGVRLRGWWLPRMALLSGATLLLGLGVANPDAWIARHNLERYESTGKVDWVYLQNLSADATPTLAELPPGEAACALSGSGSAVSAGSVDDGGWAGWNLARDRARDVLAGLELPDEADCTRGGSALE